VRLLGERSGAFVGLVDIAKAPLGRSCQLALPQHHGRGLFLDLLANTALVNVLVFASITGETDPLFSLHFFYLGVRLNILSHNLRPSISAFL